jgi:Short C-terminal domain
MTTDTTPAEERAPRRRNLARVLVVLASILAFVAIFSVWFNRQILNTDNWTKASSEMLESPVIRAELANYMSDQLYANVDVEAEIRNALPERAKPLAAPAASALRNQVEKRANQALQRPRVQELWENANRAAHQQLLAVIHGGGSGVSTQGGEVVINLQTLLQETQQRVGVGGRVAKALPASATSIEVLRSDQLDTAQTIGNTLEDLPVVLVVLSLALFGIALAVSRGWRRRAVRGYGIGLAVAGAAVLAGEAWAGDAVVESFAGTASMEPVVRTVWDIYTPLLSQAATAAIFYGVLMVFGAWLAGPTAWATAVRRALAPYLREPAIAYGAFALLVAIVVLWWAPTPAMRNPVTAVVFVLLLGFGFEMLRRRTGREFPGADRRAALAGIRERLAGMAGSVAGGARAGSDAVVRRVAAVTPGGSGGEEEERLAQLERLSELRASGVLDESEFRAEKDRILGRGQPPAPVV